jgi:hypothetical protein
MFPGGNHTLNILSLSNKGYSIMFKFQHIKSRFSDLAFKLRKDATRCEVQNLRLKLS